VLRIVSDRVLLFLYGWNQLPGEEINRPWLSALSINFHLQVDQLSFLFLLLTVIVIPFSIIATPFPEPYSGNDRGANVL
jgi:NADH:ubiquinone oxidoreductase subunit 4 (subunit M)